MVLVDNAGLFEKLPQDILDEVPAQFRPSPRQLDRASRRARRCLPTTPTLLSEDQLPKSIMDLADPSWKGKWAASPSGADFQAIVAAMLALKGEDGDRRLAQGDEGQRRCPIAATPPR